MVTYNVDVTVNDPILQDVSVIVSESSAGVLLGGLNRYVLTKNSDADNDASWKTPGGFTFVQDTTPTPTRFGETFFDNSTGATGGFAYVAIDNGSGGLTWLQYSPSTNLPASAPRGVVAYSQGVADHTGFGASVGIVNDTTVNWTAIAGRRYRFTFSGEIIQTVATDVWVLNLEDTVGGLKRITASNGNTASTTVEASYINNTSISGPTTWRAALVRAGGTGTITAGAAPTYPRYVIIEDIGAL